MLYPVMGDEACRSRLIGEEGRAEPTPGAWPQKGPDSGPIFGTENGPISVKISILNTNLAYMNALLSQNPPILIPLRERNEETLQENPTPRNLLNTSSSVTKLLWCSIRQPA
jgi:hypothetical protein